MRARFHSAGFTLIELLVAMSIFAVVAVMAYGGLDSVLKMRKQGDEHAVKLAALQTAFAILERDIEQAANRSTRDNFGDPQPAMSGDDETLEFTRNGRRNPGGFSRSYLQRIAYGIEDEELMRASWQVLDLAQDSEAATGPLLEGVTQIEFSYLDAQLEWHSEWPVRNLSQANAATPALPKAIALTIESEQWGEIKRLFRVAGAAAPVAQQNGGAGAAGTGGSGS